MYSHNFERSLSREKAQQAKADQFYQKQFNVTEIIRYSDDSEAHMNFQRQDIDLSLVKNEKRIFVSEKFRDKDFGDLYLEAYSKYPDIKGWMHTNNADFMAYFFPERIVWIDKRQLTAFYHEILSPAVPESFYQTIFDGFRNRNKIMSQTIKLQDKYYKINVIQAFNKTGMSSWHTIGVSIPFEFLKAFNVSFRIFQL